MAKFTYEDHENRIRKILNPPVENNAPRLKMKVLIDRARRIGIKNNKRM